MCQGAMIEQPRRTKRNKRFDEVGNLRKNFSKNFEKPLDKYHKMWYNINVIKREYVWGAGSYRNSSAPKAVALSGL